MRQLNSQYLANAISRLGLRRVAEWGQQGSWVVVRIQQGNGYRELNARSVPGMVTILEREFSS